MDASPPEEGKKLIVRITASENLTIEELETVRKILNNNVKKYTDAGFIVE